MAWSSSLRPQNVYEKVLPATWVFPKIGVPQNGFIIENPIKMDDLGGTTIFGNIHMFIVFVNPMNI